MPLVTLVGFFANGFVLSALSSDASTVIRIIFFIVTIAIACGAGYFLVWVDKKYTRTYDVITKDSKTGEDVTVAYEAVNDFFWIRLKYWAYVVVVVLLVVGYSGVFVESTGVVDVKKTSHDTVQAETSQDAPFTIMFQGQGDVTTAVSFESLPGCKTTTKTQVGDVPDTYTIISSARCDSASSTLDSFDVKDLPYFSGNVNEIFSVTFATTTMIAGYPAFWAYGVYPDGSTGERFYITFDSNGRRMYSLGTKYKGEGPKAWNAFIDSFTTHH